HVPQSLKRLRLACTNGDIASAHTRVVNEGDERNGAVTVDSTARSERGQPVLFVEGLRLALVGRLAEGRRHEADLFHRQHWSALPEQQPDDWEPTGSGIVFSRSLPTGGHGRGPARVVSDPDELTAAILGAPPGPLRLLWLPLVAETVSPAHIGDGGDVSRRLAEACVEAAILMRIVAAAGRANVRVWLVTQGGQAIGVDDVVDPTQTALWGLGRTLCLEHPEHWGGLLDRERPIARGSGETANSESMLEVTARYQGGELGVRGSTVYAGRIEAEILQAERPISIDPEGHYVVTGGLGGVGLEVLRWLSRRGARHITVLGRTLPPAVPAMAEDRD
ncbi:MAG TPA: KR domain-containing protein, partial [Chloroflexota bacterium]|nr:KR domain-containing protein [Chloroflexota bacterium]